jgi:hypothetical protein
MTVNSPSRNAFPALQTVMGIVRDSSEKVSQEDITAFCKTLPLMQHLGILVELSMCRCIFTAFLCWLCFPEFQRNTKFYGPIFEGLKPSCKENPVSPPPDATHNADVTQTENSESVNPSLSNSAENANIVNHLDEYPTSSNEERNLAVDMDDSNNSIVEIHTPSNAVVDQVENNGSVDPSSSKSTKHDNTVSYLDEHAIHLSEYRALVTDIKDGNKSIIERNTVSKAVELISNECLKSNDDVINYLTNLLPGNFEELNKNDKEKIFSKICQVANGIVKKRHSSETPVTTTKYAGMKTGVNEALKSDAKCMSERNSELAEILIGFYKKAPPNSKNLFLATTVRMPNSNRGDTIADLNVATYFMRFDPSGFKSIFDEIKNGGNLEWLPKAFLQFLAIKPSDTYDEVNYMNVITEGYVDSDDHIIERNVAANDNTSLNELSNEIFKWFGGDEQKELRNALWEGLKSTYANNTRSLGQIQILPDMYTFTKGDFRALNSLLSDRDFSGLSQKSIGVKMTVPNSKYMLRASENLPTGMSISAAIYNTPFFRTENRIILINSESPLLKPAINLFRIDDVLKM